MEYWNVGIFEEWKRGKAIGDVVKLFEKLRIMFAEKLKEIAGIPEDW
jgi:hypothetical protein